MVFGVILLIHALYRMGAGFPQFATLGTLTDFYVPPLLSILYLPFPYGLSIYMAYERAFIPLNANCSDDKIFAYAKKSALRKFRLNTSAMRRWIDRSHHERLNSTDQVDQSIKALKDRLAYEANPPKIDSKLGWSPFSAKDFLSEYALKTGHYKNLGEEEWFCSAPPVDIDESLFPSTLAYHVSGDKDAAKSLKLRLYVNTPEHEEGAVAYFAQVSETLLSKALDAEASTNLCELISAQQDAETSIKGKRVSIKRQDWQNRQSGGFDLTFEVAVD